MWPAGLDRSLAINFLADYFVEASPIPIIRANRPRNAERTRLALIPSERGLILVRKKKLEGGVRQRSKDSSGIEAFSNGTAEKYRRPSWTYRLAMVSERLDENGISDERDAHPYCG
jgi:hypothetical protein